MPKRPAKKTPKKSAAKKRVRKDLAGSWTPEQVAAGNEAKAKFQESTAPAVLEALFPDGVTIGGCPAIPLTVASYTFLEKIGNPITEPGGTEAMNNEQLMELCLVLTRPVRELRELLSNGTEEWLDEVYAFGEYIPLEDLQKVGLAIGGLIAQATSTVVPTAPEKKRAKAADTSTVTKKSAAKGAPSAG